MGHVQLKKLGILTSLRFEETQTEGNGPINKSTLTPAEAARRAAIVARSPRKKSFAAPFTSLASEPMPRADTTTSFREFISSMHIVRVRSRGQAIPPAWATGDRLAYSERDRQRRRAIGNDRQYRPQPQKSDNYDLNLEYSFEPIGLFSASVFWKEVTGFLYSDRSQLVPSRANNGFDGLYQGLCHYHEREWRRCTLRGFELSYQQQFTFLPGFWRGFGIKSNYTQLTPRAIMAAPSATTQVAGFRPKTGNISLSYDRNRFGAIIQTNWVDTYLTSVSTNAASITYSSPKITEALYAKFTFKLSKTLNLYFNWDNVLVEPLEHDTYPGCGGRPYGL